MGHIIWRGHIQEPKIGVYVCEVMKVEYIYWLSVSTATVDI